MANDENVHFLRPKKREPAPEADVGTVGGAASGVAARSMFEDGIVSRPDNVVPIDPRRERATEIFETRIFEDEALRTGQVLRRVREALGLRLQDVSKHSLIRENFLMAIERMEINVIPKGYLTVYLRAYASELGLPTETVISQYTQECGAVDEVKAALPVPKMGRIAADKPAWPIYVAAAGALLLLVLIGFGISLLLRKPPEADSAPQIVAAVNGARESLFETTSTRPLPEEFKLELIAVRQGWIEIRGADGTIFRSRVMAKGESYFPRLKAGWSVSAQDGGAFVWRAGEFDGGPLGPDGAAVFSLSIDNELARIAALAAAPPVDAVPVKTPVP
jgi:cytoskeleton protein RodZ